MPVRSLPLLVLCTALGLAAPVRAAPPRRQLLSVDLRSDKAATWVAITTDAPANFTSFKLRHPARVVIDFPETGAVEETRTIPDGALISGVEIENLGNGEQKVARLTVELRADADYTLSSQANAVELHLVPPTARPLVAIEDEKTASLDPIPPPLAAPVVMAAPAPEAAPVPVAVPAPPPVVPAKLIVAPRAAPEEAAASLPVVRARPPVTEREADPTPAPVAAVEPKEAVAVEPPALPEAPVLPVVVEAAAAPTRHTRARPVRLGTIGFRPSSDGPEIVLHTSGPVVYAMREAGTTRLFLDLSGTEIAVANNRRPLDTRYFDTAVLRVAPREDRAHHRVSVEIDLRSPTSYELVADRSTLTVRFPTLPTVAVKGRPALSLIAEP